MAKSGSAVTGKPTAVPTRKVLASTVAAAPVAAVVTILVWVLKTYAHVEIPEAVADSISTVLAAGAALVAGYYMPPGDGEAVVPNSLGNRQAGAAAMAGAAGD